MRGHAQMIPFGCGTPILSVVSHDKMQWFLDDIGHPGWGVDVQDPEFEQKLMSLADDVYDNYTLYMEYIANSKEVLWEITQKNMEAIKAIINK